MIVELSPLKFSYRTFYQASNNNWRCRIDKGRRYQRQTILEIIHYIGDNGTSVSLRNYTKRRIA